MATFQSFAPMAEWRRPSMHVDQFPGSGSVLPGYDAAQQMPNFAAAPPAPRLMSAALQGHITQLDASTAKVSPPRHVQDHLHLEQALLRAHRRARALEPTGHERVAGNPSQQSASQHDHNKPAPSRLAARIPQLAVSEYADAVSSLVVQLTEDLGQPRSSWGGLGPTHRSPFVLQPRDDTRNGPGIAFFPGLDDSDDVARVDMFAGYAVIEITLPETRIIFQQFVSQVLSQTLMSATSAVLALYYMHRLPALLARAPHAHVVDFQQTFAEPRSSLPFKLCTMGLMIANKHLDDNTFLNRTWHDVTGIPVKELNSIERFYLRLCHYDISPQPADWHQFLRTLAYFCRSCGGPHLAVPDHAKLADLCEAHISTLPEAVRPRPGHPPTDWLQQRPAFRLSDGRTGLVPGLKALPLMVPMVATS